MQSRLSIYSQEHEMRKKGEKQTVWMKRKDMKRAFLSKSKRKKLIYLILRMKRKQPKGENTKRIRANSLQLSWIDA